MESSMYIAFEMIVFGVADPAEIGEDTSFDRL
jgi:hypothetical protein